MILRCLIAVLTVFSISCKEENFRLIDTASYPHLNEARLGRSSYYIKFPPNMFVEEAVGKEGQLGYGLWQIDSITRYSNTSGFIEIEPGRSIGEDSNIDHIVEKVQSRLLGKTIKWNIMKTETGYFEALAHDGKLTLTGSSPTQTGLDSMISIIATLSSK